MTIQQLKTFVEKQMQPQHIYQPVMLMTLLKKGGKASVLDIATSIMDQDDLSDEKKQLEHYKDRTKKMVGPVLLNHQVVALDGEEFELLVAELSETERAEMISLCQMRLDEYKQQSSKRTWSSPDGRAADELTRLANEVSEAGHFSPVTLQDERERWLREIVQRRGQPEFRRKLIGAYMGKCAVTGCDALAALEAAHIIPYCGPQSNHVSNGLLLRADIHTLLDLNLIGIDPQMMIVALGPALAGSSYGDLHGMSIALPTEPGARPSAQALAERWKRFSVG